MTTPKEPDGQKTELDYGVPSSQQLAGNFFLRLAIGFFVGFFACIAGTAIAIKTQSRWMFFVPVVPALIVAAAYAITQRRYGAFTGIILMVVSFLVVGNFLLWAMIFSPWR